MKTVKSYNRQNDTTYVYEVLECHWDKDKKQSASKRRLIGKIDPETGEIVPTRSRKKAEKKEDSSSVPTTADVNYQKLYSEAKNQIQSLEHQVSELEHELNQLRSANSDFCSQLLSLVHSFSASTSNE